MEHDFWQRRWEKSEIGFHEGVPNSLLVRHLDSISLPQSTRIFLPLCGMTRDIHWLLSRGFRIAGAELSGIAVRQLFAELDVEPSLATLGPLIRYSANGIDIFQGDILDLTAEFLGPVDAIYDRAALVALPAPMRISYAAHLVDAADAAPQLLIAFEYDQPAMEGPPFSVTEEEVRRLYGGSYDISLLESGSVEGGLKGTCPAVENIWHLRRGARES